MTAALWVCLCAGCLLGSEEGPAGSYLYQPAYSRDDVLRPPAEPYLPQPGDLFFASDRSFWMRFGHWVCGADGPHHSGIVVARPDGGLAILHAGPFNTTKVGVFDLMEHLHAHEDDGVMVWIRRRRCPLTPEQSARLTAFAMAQDGKPFALWRMLGQLTPFRSRGALRTYFVGGPHGDRCSYFCSELVTESLVAAGLIDPACARPAATYPRDLFFDHSCNLFLNSHFHLSDCWYPPARWTSCPVGGTGP
jgi:hypothetical protein